MDNIKAAEELVKIAEELTDDGPQFPGQYVVSMTYEIVDEESAEQGDAKERGWEFENAHHDSLEEALGDSDVKWHSWLEWSSSHPSGSPHEWLISQGEENYKTGETTSYNLHIKRQDGKNLSKEEIQYINEQLGVL